jgi:hypothetical protein
MIRKDNYLDIPGRERPINIIQYEEEDIFLLQKLYTDWMNLNEKIKRIGGRPSILPPEFVEALVAYKMGYWKIDDMRLGFDCFDPNVPEGHNRIEIKYGTGRMDLSSFAPEIKWDRLNFVKFYNESPEDCFFEIYDIDIQMILEESERFGRYIYDRRGFRPRISVIKELIERGVYREKREFSLF